jgi:hypothetical protein
VVHILYEKIKIVHPSIFLFKTYKFSHQEHMAPLKLQHVATQKFSYIYIYIFNFKPFFFKKNKNKKFRGGSPNGGGFSHPHFGHWGWFGYPQNWPWATPLAKMKVAGHLMWLKGVAETFLQFFFFF